jgi:hypothetical protein
MCSYKSKKNFVSSLSDGHLNGVSIERKRKQKPPPPLPLPHHYAYKHKYLEFRLHICSLFKPKFTLLLFVWKEKGWSHSEHRIRQYKHQKENATKIKHTTYTNFFVMGKHGHNARTHFCSVL